MRGGNPVDISNGHLTTKTNNKKNKKSTMKLKADATNEQLKQALVPAIIKVQRRLSDALVVEFEKCSEDYDIESTYATWGPTPGIQTHFAWMALAICKGELFSDEIFKAVRAILDVPVLRKNEGEGNSYVPRIVSNNGEAVLQCANNKLIPVELKFSQEKEYIAKRGNARIKTRAYITDGDLGINLAYTVQVLKDDQVQADLVGELPLSIEDGFYTLAKTSVKTQNRAELLKCLAQPKKGLKKVTDLLGSKLTVKQISTKMVETNGRTWPSYQLVVVDGDGTEHEIYAPMDKKVKAAITNAFMDLGAPDSKPLVLPETYTMYLEVGSTKYQLLQKDGTPKLSKKKEFIWAANIRVYVEDARFNEADVDSLFDLFTSEPEPNTEPTLPAEPTEPDFEDILF